MTTTARGKRDAMIAVMTGDRSRKEGGAGRETDRDTRHPTGEEISFQPTGMSIEEMFSKVKRVRANTINLKLITGPTRLL